MAFWHLAVSNSGYADSLFDIFDENGRYIGQFKTDLTAEYGWFFFKNRKAYAVETDEEGYKFIKRYSIEVEDY